MYGVGLLRRGFADGVGVIVGCFGGGVCSRTGKSPMTRTYRLVSSNLVYILMLGVDEKWMDEELNVIYINEKINREEWQTFEVGKTRFTDEACRQAGLSPLPLMS